MKIIEFLRNCTLVSFVFISFSAMSQNAGINFDGVDDYIQTTYSGISGSSARTVEAWIRTTANADPNNSGVQQIITDWGTFATGQRFTFCILWGDAIRVEVGGSGFGGTTAINDGLWHHVAVVYDPTTTVNYYLYVDGVLENSSNLATTINTGTANDLMIGRRVDGSRYFDGDIDEVRVFNYARSATEISSEMNSEICNIPTSLVAYYRMNDGVINGTNSSTTIDESGGNNTGTLNNFTLSGTTSNWVAGPVIGVGATGSSIVVTTCTDYTGPAGTIFTSSGNYTETILNSVGCDSVIQIDLTIAPITHGFNASACDSYTSPSGSYTWTVAGIYNDTLQTANGCDSVITINLSLNSYYSTIIGADCSSYTSISGNNTWTMTGMYSENYTNAAGCDSIIYYDITIYGPSTATINETTCMSSFTGPNGTVYTSSGTYTEVIPTTNGCDSIITINLNLVNLNNTVTISEATLTAALNNASYQWMLCENGNLTPIPGATNQSYTASDSGSYAVEVSLNGCTNLSPCFTIDFTGVHDFDNNGSTLYPNPSVSGFTIDLGGDYDHVTVNVFDSNGKLIKSLKKMNANKVVFQEELASGMYVIQVKHEQFQKHFTFIQE